MTTMRLKQNTDMRYSIGSDPKQLSSQYRLALQPRKRSVTHITRPRRMKSDTGSRRPSVAQAQQQPPEQSSQGAAQNDSGGETTAVYIRTFSWGQHEDLKEEDLTPEEEEDEDHTEVKEEPLCQKKYNTVCRLLKCQPIKVFLRSLVTDTVAVKCQKLTSDDFKACVIALLHTDTVESVWFHENGLGYQGALRIAEILPKKVEFTELKLTNNRLGSEGARVICEAVLHNSHLRRLDLSGNDLTDDDAHLFSELMFHNHALRSLNLSHNNFRERGGEILAEGLAQNRTIQKLNLGWNHLRMAGAVAIGKSLCTNEDLEELVLAWNGFHLRGCMALGEAMARNESLTLLDLTCNRVSELSLAQLLKGLKTNTTLETLLLPLNPLSPHAAYSVLKFVDENDAVPLKLIDLGDTCVYEEFETLLKELQERREDFTVIRGPLLRTGLKFEDPLAQEEEEEEEKDNPLIFLMEYCRLQNLRVLDMFKMMDTDKSLSLTYDEFKEGLRRVNIPMSEEMLERLVKMLDENGDGEIDFRELNEGQKQYRALIQDALADGPLDQHMIGRIGMQMKRTFSKAHLMRKDF